MFAYLAPSLAFDECATASGYMSAEFDIASDLIPETTPDFELPSWLADADSLALGDDGRVRLNGFSL